MLKNLIVGVACNQISLTSKLYQTYTCTLYLLCKESKIPSHTRQTCKTPLLESEFASFFKFRDNSLLRDVTDNGSEDSLANISALILVIIISAENLWVIQ